MRKCQYPVIHRMTRICVTVARFLPARVRMVLALAAVWVLVARMAPASGSRPVITVDPYRGVNWATVLHSRANLHTHTQQSDGSLPPQQVVDEYHQRGYTILALTDHDKVTYPWTGFTDLNASYANRNPEKLGMVAIAGNELSRHHHTLSLFTGFKSVSNDLEADLTALGEYSPEAWASLCHPAMHWPSTFGAQQGFKVALTPQLRRVTQGNFTLESWFRTTDRTRNILMGNFSTAYSGSVNLELHTNNLVRVHIQSAAGVVTDLNLSADSLNIDTRDGQWHHLAGVRRDGVALLYLDGRKVGQRTDVAGAFDLLGDCFMLGRDTRGGITEFNGDLDQMRIWTRDLDAAEIARLAQGEVPGDALSRQGLLAEYTFDRPPQVDDTAGHPDGPFHASRYGPGYRVSMPPAFSQLTQGDFTVEAWFRTTDTLRNILAGNFTSPSINALNLELHTGNRVRLYVQPPAGQSGLDFFTAPDHDLRDGRWHHLAGIRHNSTVYLYVDGEEIARTNDTAGVFDLSGEAYYLGRDSRSDTMVFNGDVAPVRIWKRALTPQEIVVITMGDRGQTPVETSGLLARYDLGTSTFAPDTAVASGGPYSAYSTAFSSQMRIDDVAAPLSASGHSHSALRFGWTMPFPTEVSDDAVEYYLGLYQRHAHLRCIEVLNGTRPLREYPLDRGLWDALLTRLMPARPVWGLAVDDMHSLTHLGRDSVVVLTATLTAASVREALDAGTFYFATTRLRSGDGDVPPRLEFVTHDPVAGRIILKVTSDGIELPDDAYCWISEGKSVHTGPVLDYRAKGLTGTYARAEITGPGGTIYTNPFGLSHMAALADMDFDGIPDWWELVYFGDPTSAVSTAIAPSGMTFFEHYVVGDDPFGLDAGFRIAELSGVSSETHEMRLRWPSAQDRLYSIITAVSLSDGFTVFEGAEALAGNPPYNEFSVPVSAPSQLYKVTVRLKQ